MSKILKQRIWNFVVPLYELDLKIVAGGDRDLLRTYLNRIHKKGYKVMNYKESGEDSFDGVAAGVEFYVQDGDVATFYVWISHYDINLLAHELLHTTFEIQDYLGAMPSKDSEELYAYLNGWLMEYVSGALFKVQPRYKT